MTLAQKIEALAAANIGVNSLLPDLEGPSDDTENLLLESALGTLENLMAYYRKMYCIEVGQNL